METAFITASCIVIALHIGFMVLEMFLWNRPQGRRIFGLSQDFAQQTATLAANQGLYNGFLAAGLTWGLIAADGWILIFFLCCVIIAGIFGALSVKTSIFWIQAMPAIISLVLLITALTTDSLVTIEL